MAYQPDPYQVVGRGITVVENPTGNPAARNPRSSAMGDGQFIDSTWLSTIKAARPDIARGRNDAQLLALRADPQLSEEMTVFHTKKNAADLQAAGIPVTPETLYLAHFSGVGGAKSIMNANPNAPLGSVLGQAVVDANPQFRGMTVDRFFQNISTLAGRGVNRATQEENRWGEMASNADEDARWGAIKGADPEPAQAQPAPVEDDDNDPRWGKIVSSVELKPGDIDPVTGKPVQFMSAAPESALSRFMSRGAPVTGKSKATTAAISSLPTDPDQRARVLANQFYPDKPLNEALSYLTPDPKGGFMVLDDKGGTVYEEPSTPSINALQTLRPNNLLSWTGSLAGGALPVAGGIAGSLAFAPTSVVAGPLGAAAGAAVGDQARQWGAKLFDPTPSATPIDAMQTAKEAGLAAAGQFVGGMGANILAPNALKIPASDIRVMRQGNMLSAAEDAYANAAKQGVSLTPGQATGLPSLLQFEDAARRMPGTADMAEAFYRRQGGQLTGAGDNMLSSVSPMTDKADAAMTFQQAADDAIRLTRQNANAAARPSYQAAEKAGQVMSPDLAMMTDIPVVKSAMDRARATYKNLYRKDAPSTPDFALWDLTKRQLDDAHSVASRAGERTDAMAVDGVRKDLMTHLDAAYPTYAQARATAAPGQRMAERLEDSGVGRSAGKTGDERARAIVAPVFEQNPKAVADARKAFVAAGREDEWNNGVRAYVQDAFDKASKSESGLNPAMLRRQVWGNADVRESIRSAMTPAQFQGFENFLNVVEQAARTFPENSLTATRTQAINALSSAVENQGNVKVVDAVGSALSPQSYMNIGNSALRGLRQKFIEGNTRSIVNALFDAEGLKYLEAMARYSPRSLKAGNAAAQLLARAVPSMDDGSATSLPPR